MLIAEVTKGIHTGKIIECYQDAQTGRKNQEKRNPAHQYKPTVLFSTFVK